MKFGHIYIEEKVKSYEITKQITEKFPQAPVIEIGHYKDVFNRKHQNFAAQKKHQALILAKKEGQLVYPGAPMCQNFGHTHFYYTSCVMNCIFDCEYCYLQGMYPSGHLVLFVNIEDIFAEVDKLLGEHDVYLCVSYDTDLLALERLTGLVEKWCEFARNKKGLTIEIRTKSAAYSAIEHIRPSSNVILAWTLSPEAVAGRYEHFAAAPLRRIESAAEAAKDGWHIRLCLEPVLYIDGWQEAYKTLLEQTFDKISPGSVIDVSLGEFRVSAEYLKIMRKQRKDSEVIFYPYTAENGICRYDTELSEKMLGFIKEELLSYVKEENIYLWSEQNEM